MTIANNNIILESNYVKDLILNRLDYTKIDIEVYKNCDPTPITYSLPISENIWYIDLDTATKLENFLVRLNVQSLSSFHIVNAITAPIDLGYVEDNCAANICNLELYSAHFAPLFKNQLDGWFASIGITSNITVTFTGNTLKLGDFPTDFIPASADYGIAAPYSRVFSSYGVPTSQVFLSSTALHIKPGYFNLSKFEDGVFKFRIKYVKAGGIGHIIEENCAFLDITTKCKVASLLKNLSKENNDESSKGVSTIVHLLHYSLVNSSNCGCNCDEMCTVYKELANILNGLDPQTLDCGC